MNVARVGAVGVVLVVMAGGLPGCTWRDCGLGGCDDDRAGGSHTASAPRDGREAATLDVVSAATVLTVRAADVGDDLYRVSTPDDSAVAPRPVVADDRVRMHLVDTGAAGPKALDVRLNPAVRWDVLVTGGQTEVVVDLSGGRVGAVELAGGASRIELSLPRPAGTRTVTLAGGASQLVVHAPDGVPVRVRAGSGAGQVSVDGREHRGVSAGAAFAPAGWDGASDRYDIDCTAGVGTVTVDRTDP